MVNFVHFHNTKYRNYHAPCQLCGNDQRLRSGFNFRLPTVWDAPSSVYEISMIYSAGKFDSQSQNDVPQF